METCFNYTDKERAFFSTDERKFITKVRRLQERFPDEVRIIAKPEENDGCLYCELPTAWFTIRVPKKVYLTDEQRSASAERLRAYHKRTAVVRKNRSKTASTDEDE